MESLKTSKATGCIGSMHVCSLRVRGRQATLGAGHKNMWWAAWERLFWLACSGSRGFAQSSPIPRSGIVPRNRPAESGTKKTWRAPKDKVHHAACVRLQAGMMMPETITANRGCAFEFTGRKALLEERRGSVLPGRETTLGARHVGFLKICPRLQVLSSPSCPIPKR